MPMIDQFKQEWGGGFGNVFHQVAAGIGNGDSDIDENSTDQPLEEFTEDVSVFAISPQGTYLVAFVTQEFLVLKMLPGSMNPNFRNLLTPSFMIQEHLFMPAANLNIDLSTPFTGEQQQHDESEKLVRVERDKDD